MMSKKKVIQNRVMDVDELVPFLEDVIFAIKDGTLTVDQGDEYISFSQPDNVEVSVKARQTPKKESYSLKLHWVTKLTETQGEAKFHDYDDSAKAEKPANVVVNVVEEEKTEKDTPVLERPVTPSFHQQRNDFDSAPASPNTIDEGAADEDAANKESASGETANEDSIKEDSAKEPNTIPPLMYVDGAEDGCDDFKKEAENSTFVVGDKE